MGFSVISGAFRKTNYWRKSHRIEVFAAAVFFVALLMAVDLFSISMRARNLDNDVLTNQAIYASEFVTSLSGVKGYIENVYVNEDLTRCGILVRFTDTSNIITDALMYQVFVKGFNIRSGSYAPQTLSNPKGGYYMFGSTGYALIYLVDSGGFANQAIECVVRCNEVIHESSYYDETMNELKERDASYLKHDQFRIIVNPAAELAERVTFLDNMDVVSLYQYAVINARESDIRQQLADDVSGLYTQYKAAAEYKRQLLEMGVRDFSVPDFMSGDEFVENNAMGTLTYKPGMILSGGVDFDWFNNTLSDTSFLSGIAGQKKATQFFGDIAAAPRDSYTPQSDFYWLDGTIITENVSSPLDDVAKVSQVIANYRSAVQSYFSLKYQYQRQDLVTYLQLEYNMLNTGQNFTSNYTSGTVTVW